MSLLEVLSPFIVVRNFLYCYFMSVQAAFLVLVLLLLILLVASTARTPPQRLVYTTEEERGFLISANPAKARYKIG